MVDAALGDMGRIDIMINNVGGASNVDGGVSSLRHATEDWYRKLFATNLEVPIAASRRAAEATIESGDGGAIINIASINARGPSPTLAFYAAAKAALVSITETMATEYGSFGIRVNAIAPAIIRTAAVSRLLATDAG